MKNWTNEEIIQAIETIKTRMSNWHRYERHEDMYRDRDSLSAFIAEMDRRSK